MISISDEAGKDIIKYVADLKSVYANFVLQKINAELENLKSDSNEKALIYINSGAYILAKTYTKADRKIDQISNTIKDKTTPKIQILLQAVLTIRAVLSSDIHYKS